MAGLINDLMDVLNDMAESLNSLVELSEQKKDVIIKNDIDTLKKITSHENVLTGRCQKLERRRAAISKDIALVLGEKETSLTLSRLAEIIKDQDEYAPFSGASQKLRGALAKLKELNAANRELIENSLEYIDFSVNVIRSTFDDDPFLEERRDLGDNKSFFDMKS